jgi:hypothetical protein
VNQAYRSPGQAWADCGVSRKAAQPTARAVSGTQRSTSGGPIGR